MSPDTILLCQIPERPLPTLDDIFDAWITFGGDSTLDEFTMAYLSVSR